MIRNIAIGIFLIGAIALSSCSTTKLASAPSNDDVYFSKAEAADEPAYAAQPNYSQVQSDDEDDSDDYFYYDDYASRINRFSYGSPFGYYDDLYYGYNGYPYNNGFSLGYGYGGYAGGWGLGLGLGYGGYGYSGYGYGGWGLGLGYGYGGLGYGYGLGYGLGYGYGGYYGGGYGGGFTGGRPRPYRGAGNPYTYRGGRSLSNQATGIGYIPGGRGVRTNGVGSNNSGYSRSTRPVRTDRPSMQPNVDRSPAPASIGGGTRGGGGGAGSSGGGRPVRP